MSEQQIVITAQSTADVVQAVSRAEQEGKGITVVSGGHGLWSHQPDEGVRLELTGLAEVSVGERLPDGTTRVSIGGGATWGGVARALADHGLAISSGDTSSVGVGGLTLGGGVGWMVRAWGLAADQLIGAQVVTASGEVVETSADRHPDLFWGLRGGGGNFGVVTRFDFSAHPLPRIGYAEYVVDGDAAAALRAAREAMAVAPREVTATYMDVPPMDPSAPAGARLSAVWAGDDVDALRSALAAVEAQEGVSAEFSVPAYREILLEMPAPEGEGPVPGFIGGNGLFAELDDALIERLVAFRASYPASVLFLRSLGGAFGEVAQEDTAFPARHATWFVMAGGFDIPGLLDDETRTAIAADWKAIEEQRIAEYGNFTSTESPESVPGMFTAEAYARLRDLKRTWDPAGLFRRNHTII